jgi:hypothetical protein
MKPLIMAFVIAAIVIAFVQLPMASAGTLTGVVFLSGLLITHMKSNKTT